MNVDEVAEIGVPNERVEALMGSFGSFLVDLKTNAGGLEAIGAIFSEDFIGLVFSEDAFSREYKVFLGQNMQTFPFSSLDFPS